MVRRPVVAPVTKPARTASAAPKVDRSERPARQVERLDREDATPVAPSRPERAPVIQSKIQPPPIRSSTLSRQRLLDKLNDAVASRLTLVIAEAGYGKTTLLADFASRASARCLWYRLDPTDADPITWTNYLIAAAREVDPTFGDKTLSLLAQVGPGGPPDSAFIASLLGELPRLGEAPTILVLDDFHAVDASQQASDIVARLIKDAPPWLHFVISSRRRPTLELARLAGMGEVAEVTTDDLRFTQAETARLFADGYGMTLDPDVLTEVGTRTHGWAASLQLLHGSIRGRPSSAIRTLVRSLSGANGPIYDFLAQEVLNNLPAEIEEFLMRAALLDGIVADHVVALFADRRGLAPDTAVAQRWIEEADRLGLLTRYSQASDARQLHPLLRDFLLRRLRQHHTPEAIKEMHLSLAHSMETVEPLVASRHFIEAGDDASAMRCLGGSVLLTLGSGMAGVAADLLDRLEDVPGDPAVTAIRARRCLDEGDLAAARQLLANRDISTSAPEIRAAFRHAQLSLGWRTGDREGMFRTLRSILSDTETPKILREIAQVFIDASPLAPRRASLPSLAQRLQGMAESQAKAGLNYYAAISLHNAACAHLNSGDLKSAVRVGDLALSTFDRLAFTPAERYSTHSILAAAHLELGNRALADGHMELALSSGDEFADVPAELALDAIATGDRKTAAVLLTRADSLVSAGKTDASASMLLKIALSFADLPMDPTRSIRHLLDTDTGLPMEFGHQLSRETVLALAYLLASMRTECLAVAEPALEEAHDRLARPTAARLRILTALARQDSASLMQTLIEAASIGHLALADLADGIADHLDLIGRIPDELADSITRWPARWLPVLRRHLDKGDVPSGRIAAQLLDQYGELEDVARLRAYARTYGRRGRLALLGLHLAQRVSPPLMIHDLGRVSIQIADRSVALAAMRRKPASLLIFLVTRPSLAANREQVIEDLWPESDPASASNSLNQTLYFLRRELDPWYEDEISVDYVSLQGELVWLDPSLVKADSAEFLVAAQRVLKSSAPIDDQVQLIESYGGMFAPEFEYDDWAMSWRSRVHTAFLELVSRTVNRAVRDGNLEAARDAAVSAIDVEPENTDLERQLVWLYWHLGSRSAAAAQHEHLASQERQDGLPVSSLQDIVSQPSPL